MGAAGPSRGAFKAVVRRRDFRRLLEGLAVSEAGDWLYNVAFLVYILNRTHSGPWVAAATVARLLPYVLVGPLGGLFAERHDFRRVMIGSDLIRAALMGALGFLAVLNGPPLGALVLAFLSTSAGCAYVPAVAAMTPSIVDESELAAANALIQTVANVAIVHLHFGHRAVHVGIAIEAVGLKPFQRGDGSIAVDGVDAQARIVQQLDDVLDKLLLAGAVDGWIRGVFHCASYVADERTKTRTRSPPIPNP